MMRALTLDIETAAGGIKQFLGVAQSALALAYWDAGFTQALLRLCSCSTLLSIWKCWE
ncbi:hypothetical protein [Celeribacter sp.]|uniref:hypothetical protein n=1 Tax=Celeribacter sp. TaxID=1890673 RepID=UPI003A8F5E76